MKPELDHTCSAGSPQVPHTMRLAVDSEGRIIRTWLITTTPTGIVANPDPAALEQHPRRPAGPTGAAG